MGVAEHRVQLQISESMDAQTSPVWEKLKIMYKFPENTLLSWEFLTGWRRTAAHPPHPPPPPHHYPLERRIRRKKGGEAMEMGTGIPPEERGESESGGLLLGSRKREEGEADGGDALHWGEHMTSSTLLLDLLKTHSHESLVFTSCSFSASLWIKYSYIWSLVGCFLGSGAWTKQPHKKRKAQCEELVLFL